MPRNEHFLPQNNGNHSESIPRNFFRNEIPFPTLVEGRAVVVPPSPWQWKGNSVHFNDSHYYKIRHRSSYDSQILNREPILNSFKSDVQIIEIQQTLIEQ